MPFYAERGWEKPPAFHGWFFRLLRLRDHETYSKLQAKRGDNKLSTIGKKSPRIERSSEVFGQVWMDMSR